MSLARRPIPQGGVFEGLTHLYACRVYFEDTDFSGVVYHASYLRFMERARSDLLRLIGIDQAAAFAAGEGVYAVADLQIRYVSPARMGDALVIETQCLLIGGATVTMGQRILEGTRLVVDATVRAAFLTPDGRPRRPPPEWRARFQALGVEGP